MLLLPMTPLGLAGGAFYTLFFLVLWGVVLVVSPVWLLLMWWKKVRGYQHFIPTLLVIANVYLGLFAWRQAEGLEGGGGYSGWNIAGGVLDVLWAVLLAVGIWGGKKTENGELLHKG